MLASERQASNDPGVGPGTNVVPSEVPMGEMESIRTAVVRTRTTFPKD